MAAAAINLDCIKVPIFAVDGRILVILGIQVQNDTLQ